MKRALLISTPLLVLLSGGIFYWAVTASVPNVNAIPRPLPLPSPNGFDFFAQAGTVAERDDVRADALVQQGLALPCVYPSTRGAMTDMLPEVAAIRQLARRMQVRALELQKAPASDTAAWNRSVQLGLDTLDIGSRVPKGGALIASLVGDAIIAIGNSALTEAPLKVEAATAHASAQRIEKIIALRPPLAEVLCEDKYQAQSAFLTEIGNRMKQKGVSSDGFHPLANPIKAFLYYDTTRYYDSAIADSTNPYASPRKLARPLSPMASILSQVLTRTRFNESRAVVTLQLLEVRFALRAFKIKHGNYPAQLSELVPHELSAIPIDAYGGGEALRYGREGMGYRLWSLGPDGKDDKGRPLPMRKGRGKSRYYAPESVGDIVVLEPASDPT